MYVGRGIGMLVGTSVGSVVGTLVGMGTGGVVGKPVGCDVGTADGTKVGTGEGGVVGTDDGTGVGQVVFMKRQHASVPLEAEAPPSQPLPLLRPWTLFPSRIRAPPWPRTSFAFSMEGSPGWPFWALSPSAPPPPMRAIATHVSPVLVQSASTSHSSAVTAPPIVTTHNRGESPLMSPSSQAMAGHLAVGEGVGTGDGGSVGRDVGALVGTPVGKLVGSLVGRPVGTLVGVSVGLTLMYVGSDVGRGVGMVVGSPDGSDVGTDVGDVVGANEGMPVVGMAVG